MQLWRSPLQGFSATVFAYGATGSGKTHTMIGSAEAGPGVMVQAIDTLFEHIHREENDHRFQLKLVTHLAVMRALCCSSLSLP